MAIVILIGEVVALVFGVIGIVENRRNWAAWGVTVLAGTLLIARLA